MFSSAYTDCVPTRIYINQLGTNASMRQGVGQSLVVSGHVFVSSVVARWTNDSCENRRFLPLSFKRNSSKYFYSSSFSKIMRIGLPHPSPSSRVIGLSRDTMFGYKIPFNIHTCEFTTGQAGRKCSQFHYRCGCSYACGLPNHISYVFS